MKDDSTIYEIKAGSAMEPVEIKADRLRIIDQGIEIAALMPQGEERDALLIVIARRMRASLSPAFVVKMECDASEFEEAIRDADGNIRAFVWMYNAKALYPEGRHNAWKRNG